MVTGSSGTCDIGRPAKPDIGGRKQKIKSVQMKTIKHPKPKLVSVKL